MTLLFIEGIVKGCKEAGCFLKAIIAWEVHPEFCRIRGCAKAARELRSLIPYLWMEEIETLFRRDEGI